MRWWTCWTACNHNSRTCLSMLGIFVTHLPGCAGTTLASIAHRVRCAAAAQLALGLEAIADPQLNTPITPITPTLAHAGNARITVPGEASLAIDVRAATVNERQRVDDALRKMQSATGASMKVEGGIDRPPLEEAATLGLLKLAQRSAKRCGLPPLGSTQVDGGSDGNFTAALGIATLDGLGAIGAQGPCRGRIGAGKRHTRACSFARQLDHRTTFQGGSA